MDDKRFTVTLEDGTELSGLRQNGSYYISDTPVTAETFDGNCYSVTISDGENAEEHENMELINIIPLDGGYGFALRQRSEEEIKADQLRADVDYALMMLDDIE